MKKGYNNYRRMYGSLREDESKPQEDVATENEVKEETPNEKFGKVDYCDAVNVRQEPKSDAKILMVIAKDDKVKILDESQPNFYQISYALESREIKGYINKNFITLLED